MVNIGLLGLDTSHSEGFAEIISNHEDANVSAVWDGGDVRSNEYCREFGEKYNAPVYDDPDELLDVVDAAMVLTVNWDTHRELATPFLETGVATMVDKPVAGCTRDIRGLKDAVSDTAFFGGSAVPYHPTLTEKVAQSSGKSLYCVGYGDPFYYGVHLVDTVCQLAGTDWVSVTPAEDPGQTVDILFEDDTYATLRLDGPKHEETFIVLDTEGAQTTLVGSTKADLESMYQRYVDTFLESVKGTHDASHRVLNSASLLLAVHAALEHSRPITPQSTVLDDHHVNGDAFLSEYQPYY
ncbi:Gfo/Idh/MocA family protein [Haloprofundus salinisoli]|uniref:Gfo/Idh/MocA family protein n=1 Tax=Haloprofundus salinisoli TaxID=2876193 RepID=UPI001CCB0F9C|nr:Gfo/Idh/MocA family oxidoreductase [Haloprofundus salinisoli]